SWHQIHGSHEVLSGQMVKFGQLKSIFKVEYKPMILTTSCLEPSMKKTVKSMTRCLGGHVLSDWRKICTMLVMSNLSVTIKVICALVSLKPIVTPQYLLDLKKAVENNQPLPKINKYTPPLAESQLDPNEVSFQANPLRSSLFTGKIFIFLSTKQFKKLSLAVELAGGTPMLMEEGTDDNDDGILVAKETCVMQCDINDMSQQLSQNATEWVTHVMKYLKSHKRRPIPDSELGYAVLYCSTERYCNPDINAVPPAVGASANNLPSQTLSQAADITAIPEIQKQKSKPTFKKPEPEILATNTELVSPVGVRTTHRRSLGDVTTVPDTERSSLNASTFNQKTPVEQRTKRQIKREEERPHSEQTNVATTSNDSTMPPKRKRDNVIGDKPIGVNGEINNTRKDTAMKISIKEEPISQPSVPMATDDVAMQQEDIGHTEPKLESSTPKVRSKKRLQDDDDDDDDEDDICRRPVAKAQRKTHIEDDDDDDDPFASLGTRPRSRKTKPQITTDNQITEKDIKIENTEKDTFPKVIDKNKDRTSPIGQTSTNHVAAEKSDKRPRSKKSDAKDVEIPPGWLSTEASLVNGDCVPTDPRFEKDAELPNNLVVTETTSLVKKKQQENNRQRPMTDIDGFCEWKGKRVRNFKRFSKTTHAGAGGVPRIIGGRDLEWHSNKQRQELDDWFNQELQIESQQDQDELLANKLFESVAGPTKKTTGRGRR
ncbi:unnamed protein product, partial [Owenia fusiformis]